MMAVCFRFRLWASVGCAAMLFILGDSGLQAGQFETLIQPLVNDHCIHCHSGNDANGIVDFETLENRADLVRQPALILAMLEALESYDMPPKEEPDLVDPLRSRAIQSLKGLLREATANTPRTNIPMRRLNRFQYNYAVKDLF